MATRLNLADNILPMVRCGALNGAFRWPSTALCNVSRRPARHCLDRKKAKLTKQSGEAPQIGHVWCEKRHAEFGKQRDMECFE